MSKPNDASLSQSLTAGSEEYVDVICDPCHSESQQIQATGHCAICNENLCFSCVKFHKKTSALKRHIIQDLTLSFSHRANISIDKSSEELVEISKPKYQHDINVYSDTDTRFCAINGIIVLTNGRLALSDFCNKSVKLVDIKKRTVSKQIKLDSGPFDLTLIKGNKIAVTVNGDRQLQVLSVSPPLSKCQSIPVLDLYIGIEYDKDKLILVCQDPIKGVHICDMSGVVLQQIKQDNGGNRLFTQPLRIAVSLDSKLLYITDYRENSVVSLTTEGQIVSKYTSDRLHGVGGITVDDDGCIYVCSGNEHSVHQLSPRGEFKTIILGESDGIKFPGAIAYSAGHLYVSRISTDPTISNDFKVYKFEK